MRVTGTSLGRVTSVALAFAGVWSALVIAGGFLLPIYASESASTGEVVHGSRTVVGVNGSVAIIVICVPAAATLLVWALLELRSRRAARGAVLAAWLVVVLLAAFAVLTIVSIGVAVFPVAVALLVAVRARRARRTSPEAAAAR